MSLPRTSQARNSRGKSLPPVYSLNHRRAAREFVRGFCPWPTFFRADRAFSRKKGTRAGTLACPVIRNSAALDHRLQRRTSSRMRHFLVAITLPAEPTAPAVRSNAFNSLTLKQALDHMSMT